MLNITIVEDHTARREALIDVLNENGHCINGYASGADIYLTKPNLGRRIIFRNQCLGAAHRAQQRCSAGRGA